MWAFVRVPVLIAALAPVGLVISAAQSSTQSFVPAVVEE